MDWNWCVGPVCGERAGEAATDEDVEDAEKDSSSARSAMAISGDVGDGGPGGALMIGVFAELCLPVEALLSSVMHSSR
jgi:hypothetical protein